MSESATPQMFVEVQPDLNELRVTAPPTRTSEPVTNVLRFVPDGEAAKLANQLAYLLTTMGSGEHDLTVGSRARVPDEMGTDLHDVIVELAANLPESVFYHGPFRRRGVWQGVRIANAAVTSSAIRATPEEFAEHEDWLRQEKEAEDIRSIMAPGYNRKGNLADYDHAILTFGQNRYHLPLQTADGILTARIIGLFVPAPNRQHLNPITIKAIESNVLSGLTPDERAIINEALKNEHASPIASVIERIVRKISIDGKPLLTRYEAESDPRAFTHREYVGSSSMRQPKYGLTKKTDMEVTLSRDSLRDSRGELSYLGSAPTKEATEASEQLIGHIEYAQELIASLLYSRRPDIDHATAVDILDFIMDPRGKGAINEALKEDKLWKRKGAALLVFHRIVRQVLGNPAYESAHKERVIAGGGSWDTVRRVQQVGGRLPGDTKHIDTKDETQPS